MSDPRQSGSADGTGAPGQGPEVRPPGGPQRPGRPENGGASAGKPGGAPDPGPGAAAGQAAAKKAVAAAGQPGIASIAGDAKDAKDAIKGGDAMGAADAGVRAGAKAAAEAAAPGLGGKAASVALDSKVGRKATRGGSYLLIAGISLPFVGFFALIVVMAMFAASLVGGVAEMVRAACLPSSDVGSYRPGEQGDMGNAKYIWKSLRGAGLSPEAAAGVLGNLEQESGFDPTIHQIGGGPGRGIAQWSAGERWDTSEPNLVDYAKKQGLGKWSLQAQVGFMLKEMRMGWGSFDMSVYKRMDDPAEAAVYFHKTYEVSADSDATIMAQRAEPARRWFTRFKDEDGPLPGLPPTVPVDYVPGVGGGSSDTYMPVNERPGGWSLSSGLGPEYGGAGYSRHTGMDFGLDEGTPVFAMRKGVVVEAKEMPGYEPRLAEVGLPQNGFYSYGRYATIKHDGGVSTKYAHFSRMDVKAGQTVQAGEQIGLVGNVGNSRGAHLHFEVRVGGQIREPLTFLRNAGAKEPKGGVAGGTQDGGASIEECLELTSGQTQVSADECPTRAPAGSLRNGAERIGVRKLCEKAVAEARTPEAAKAIIYAFQNLGAPYSQSARDTEGVFDCTALIYKAYQAAGVNRFFSASPYTVTYSDESSWEGVLARTAKPRAGDIRIMWRPEVSMATSGGSLGHGQMYLTKGFIIQSGGSSSNGDSSVNVASDTDWGWPTADFKYVGTGGAGR